MTELVFPQILYVLARFPCLSCWVGESSMGVLGLGAACLAPYSAVVFRSTYSLNELFIWFGIWGSYSLVYANSLQSLHVYIFSGCLYFLLAAFFLWQINQPSVTHVPGTAAQPSFTGDHVRSYFEWVTGVLACFVCLIVHSSRSDGYIGVTPIIFFQ